MNKFTGLILAGAAALSMTVAAAEASGGNKVRERCKVRADDVGKLDARWEIKRLGSERERRRFRAQFEADDASGLLAGALIDVYVSTVIDPVPVPPVVDMVLVGQMTLKQDSEGDLGSKLRFDTKPHLSPTHPWQPFPAVWPLDVAEGTTVELRNGATSLLMCDL